MRVSGSFVHPPAYVASRRCHGNRVYVHTSAHCCSRREIEIGERMGCGEMRGMRWSQGRARKEGWKKSRKSQDVERIQRGEQSRLQNTHLIKINKQRKAAPPKHRLVISETRGVLFILEFCFVLFFITKISLNRLSPVWNKSLLDIGAE